MQVQSHTISHTAYTGASNVDTGIAETYNVTYAGNPIKEIPQLSLTNESSDLLITSASTITDA